METYRSALIKDIRDVMENYGKGLDAADPLKPFAPREVFADPTVNLMTQPDEDAPTFIVEPAPEGSYTYLPANELKHEFRLTITGKMTADMSNPFSRMEAWEGMYAYIEMALTRDITRGGWRLIRRFTRARR